MEIDSSDIYRLPRFSELFRKGNSILEWRQMLEHWRYMEICNGIGDREWPCFGPGSEP
jgi:hypothetical protein